MPTLTYTTGIVDTMLREATPTQSYGTAGTLSVDNDDAGTGFDKQALLQFTGLFGTASNQIPYGARITSAALTLQSTDAGDGVALHRMLTSWTGAATWAGFGGNGIQAGSEAAASADLTTGRLGTLGATSFDVTASVQAWSNGALNYGWAFLPLGSNGWSFSSAEGATP